MIMVSPKNDASYIFKEFYSSHDFYRIYAIPQLYTFNFPQIPVLFLIDTILPEVRYAFKSRPITRVQRFMSMHYRY
jgi:hypothetical protein